MAAEFERLVRRLKAGGHDEAAIETAKLSKFLLKRGLIPDTYIQSTNEEFPLFEFEERPQNLPLDRVEIDILGLSNTTRNTLIRNGYSTLRSVVDTSDDKLKSIRNFGEIRVNELKEKLMEVKGEILLQKEKLGLTSDEPIILHFPRQSNID